MKKDDRSVFPGTVRTPRRAQEILEGGAPDDAASASARPSPDAERSSGGALRSPSRPESRPSSSGSLQSGEGLPSRPSQPSRSSQPSRPSASSVLEGTHPHGALPPEDGAERWRRYAGIAKVWGKRIGIVAAGASLVGAVSTVVVVNRLEADLPSVTDLRGNYHPPQVTRLLARDGSSLAELFTERRTVVPIATLPAHVKLAVLAAEDAGFYEHEGLNYLGIARAFLKNLRPGHAKQGGSTITQQVVKNILLDPERTYRRKIKEALLSRRLEQELTKDDILELYLNHIYFGHGRYGIEEASRDNFGKPARELTIAEAALLAGLVAGPESFSPRRDMKKALTRRAFVLSQMHEKGFLNDAQYEAAKDEPVRLAPTTDARDELAPEVVEVVRRTLAELVGDDARRGGYTVTTTIDVKLQAAARKAVRENLQAYDKRHGQVGPLHPPAVATADRKGKVKPQPRDVPFEGTPRYEAHKILVGTVVAGDDAQGVLDVRVGTVLGSVRLADYARYNPQSLPATQFAPPGTLLRVSLLAPVPESAVIANPDAPLAVKAKVPLRLELGPEGVLVALDVRSRGVLALVGNYEGALGALDRALQSKRQPGSTFKPVVYSYALHARTYTPATLVDVNPEVFDGGYKPSNYEGWTGHDPLRLREALANSVNVVAVRVLRDVGPANVVAWGESLGIKSTLKPDLSLALGSYEVQPLELAAAYATFAAGGMYEEPRIITKIVGPDGKEVPLKPVPPPRRVLEEAEAYVTTNMLTSVVDHGTAARAKALRRPLAGKTGTSNASKDTWFAGYSTDVAAVTWVGYDDGKPLGSETGGSLALPAWMEFMKAAHEGKPPSEFPRPPGVVSVRIDPKSGKLASPDAVDALDEVFLAGTEPAEMAEPSGEDHAAPEP